jgi:hypothetical protein
MRKPQNLKCCTCLLNLGFKFSKDISLIIFGKSLSDIAINFMTCRLTSCTTCAGDHRTLKPDAANPQQVFVVLVRFFRPNSIIKSDPVGTLQHIMHALLVHADKKECIFNIIK